MTPKQRKLARHALGLPNRIRQSCRNYFRAAYVPGDLDEWDTMVRAEMAESSYTIYKDTVRFWLTPRGARAALDPGESLCPEDFPQHP